MRSVRLSTSRLVGICAGLSLLAGCDTSVSAPVARSAPSFNRSSGEGGAASDAAHRDLAALRDTLLAADAAWAAYGATRNLVESLAAPMAADGIFLAPGAGFVRGPDAVRELLDRNPANRESKWRWVAIRADVSSDGQHGYTYGYSEQVTPTGVILPGKYQAYWVRQADGSWKMASFKRSARTPGNVSLVPPAGFETPTAKHRRYYPNTEPATELAAVEAVDLAFSDDAQSNVAAAFAKYVAPDGAQTAGTATSWAFGASAIRDAWEGTPSSFRWAPELGAVATSGDLGFTVGYVYSGSTIISKYFTVWQKQPDGTWRYVVD